MKNKIYFEYGNPIMETAGLIGWDLIANEDKIDLRRTGLSVDEAERAINCDDNLKMDNKDLPEKVYDSVGNFNGTIAEKEFMRIHNLFTDAFKKQYGSLPTENYITALRIHYGVAGTTPNHALKLVYEPVLYQNDLVIDVETKLAFYNEKKLLESNKQFYICNSKGEFESIVKINADRLKSTYETEIRIRHFSNNIARTKFIKNHDAESAMFSFQEIFNFIRFGANPQTAIPRPVTVFNAINYFPHDPVIERRHGLILSPNSSANDVQEAYANLAHLCPPHRDIYYRLV